MAAEWDTEVRIPIATCRFLSRVVDSSTEVMWILVMRAATTCHFAICLSLSCNDSESNETSSTLAQERLILNMRNSTLHPATFPAKPSVCAVFPAKPSVCATRMFSIFVLLAFAEGYRFLKKVRTWCFGKTCEDEDMVHLSQETVNRIYKNNNDLFNR